MLLFVDGFDSYSSSNTNALISNAWRNTAQIAGLTVATSPEPVHQHGRVAVLNSSSDNLQMDFSNMENFPGENLTGLVGLHFRTTNFTLSSTVPIIGWMNENNEDYQITLRTDTDGDLQLYRGNSTFLAEGSRLSVDTWYHLEIKFRISNSIPGNSFIVRLDGTNDIVLGAGTDTQGQADSKCGGLKLPGAASKNRYIDNFYVCDLQGSQNNDFIGPAFIETLNSTFQGTISGWTGSDGNNVDNYVQIQEPLNDDDTSFNAASTSGATDRYVYPDPTGNIGIIRGINMMTRGRKTTTAKGFLRNVPYISGVEETQPQYALHNQYRYFNDILEVNPRTNENWITTQIFNNEFGIKFEK